jgi:hypothetical protein
MSQPMIFFGGHRKGGTTLLLNLFDDHPDLCVYPQDINVLYAYHPKFTRVSVSAAERRERLRTILFRELEAGVAKWRPKKSPDVERAEQLFFEDLDDGALDDPTYVLSRFAAILNAVTGGDKPVVFKETSCEIYADMLLDRFPDSKFVQILRDPRDNFAALKSGVTKYYGKFGEDEARTLASLINRAGLGFRYADSNQQQFGPDRYKVVRFEDLVENPEAVTRDLCEFLGITFANSLLCPSYFGVPVSGNSHEGTLFQGVSKQNKGRWRERISEREAATIEFFLEDQMEEWGYESVFDIKQKSVASSEFYEFYNYNYFYFDRFAENPKS